MKDNEDLRKTYNKIAVDWSLDHGADNWWVPFTDNFLSLLPKGASIIDVGCGSGYKTKYISDKGFNVLGTDFSEGMIQYAKSKFPELNFEVFDVYDFNKYPKTFDGIFVQAMLLHIPKKNVIEVLEKMKSRLNNGGLLHIVVKEIKVGQSDEEIKKEDDYGYEYERFFSYYTLDELAGDFKKIGLEVIDKKIINSGRSNWISIIGKNNN